MKHGQFFYVAKTKYLPKTKIEKKSDNFNNFDKNL